MTYIFWVCNLLWYICYGYYYDYDTIFFCQYSMVFITFYFFTIRSALQYFIM